MLAPAQIAEIRQLLLEGRLSRRAIARQCGVSRNTVASIAAVKCKSLAAPSPDADDPPPPPAAPRRCPGCGGMIYGRCRLCRMRSRRKSHGLPATADAFTELEGPLGIELRPADQLRYEEVRALRLQNFTSNDLQESAP